MATTKRKNNRDGDSPITVGGGGGSKRRPKTTPYVEVNFDHNVWTPDPQQNDNNVDDTRILDYVEISGGAPIQLTPNTRLEIRYTNGGTYKITINDRKTGVRFNRSRLVYVGNGTHRGDNLLLKDYRIDNNPRVPLPPPGPWNLIVHTKFTRRRRR